MSISVLRRNTILGLVASTLLAAIKLAAGVVGHSSALVADAVESLADSVGSVIVWLGIEASARPPDADHPYGHGKAEAVAALAVGGLLILAAVFILVEATAEILTPHSAPRAWTLIVLVLVVVAKEGLFRIIERQARRAQSTAAEADAWHHRSDAITSAAAFVGVSIAIWGPQATGLATLVLADEVAAMLASGIIVQTAVRLIAPSLRELLDAAPHELLGRIRVAAEEVQGVVLVEKVYARKSGRGYLVDMHVHVDAELSVRAAHGLAGKVKAHVCATLPAVASVLIHIEPDDR